MMEYLVFSVEREFHSHQITVCWHSPDVQCSPAQAIVSSPYGTQASVITEGCAGKVA